MNKNETILLNQQEAEKLLDLMDNPPKTNDALKDLMKEKTMKVVLNTSYGHITEESEKMRFNKQFIEDVESGRFVGRVIEGSWGGYAETLQVFEIPDNATDYKIVNYDGAEGILYVQDGQIHFKGCEESYRIFQ